MVTFRRAPAAPVAGKPSLRLPALAAVGLLSSVSPLAAQQAGVEPDTITVQGRAADLIGQAGTASEGRIGSADLRLRPISREGELLEAIPGVFVGQHSGDGKANQYFTPGFNLDHGTDFQIRLEGMPINQPSHVHGQGYADLNFVIPELVDHIDYRLGLSHAELGDFGSGGGAELHLVQRLARPFLAATGGENGFERLAGGGMARLGAGNLLVGGEAKRYDGPWDLEERLRKVSGVARYSWERGASRFSLLGMAYHNSWNASDQIPLRAVEQGRIDRFGSIDSTDGGTTQRYSVSGSWRHDGPHAVQEVQVFGIYSDIDLFSNLTYFLGDTTQGDQLNQQERRLIFGGSLTHRQLVRWLGVEHRVKVGLQTSVDIVDGPALFHSAARQRADRIRADDVDEWGTGLFAETESRWSRMFRTVFAVRGDYYTFTVAHSSLRANDGDRTAGIVSPKGSLILAPAAGIELYLSGGLGFHSSDARATTITVDPGTHAQAQRADPLVRSRGGEVGVRVTPAPGWQSTISAWVLKLDGDLLFATDAGTTVPSPPTRRWGVTFANFARLAPRLALDADVSLARARFSDAPSGADRIPGAVESVVSAGIAWDAAEKGPFGAVRLRHLGAYPLVADNVVRSSATTLLAAEAGYLVGAGLRVEASVLNIFDTKGDDAQYFYASRLRGEPLQGVAGVHFHPTEPRQVRVGLVWGR